jgi:alpha-ribazole phosphatase
MGTRRLLAVRHAPTVLVGLCVGSAEIPCTMTAEVAAERILPLLSQERLTYVWSSPSERCKGPASFLAQSLNLPLCIDERLKEICLGRWQLRSWESIEATEPERYRYWLENWLTQAPPGGELVTAVLHRVGEWWGQLPAGEHLLISHAGVNRALRVIVHGKSWTQAMTVPAPHLQGECFEQDAAPTRTFPSAGS